MWIFVSNLSIHTNELVLLHEWKIPDWKTNSSCFNASYFIYSHPHVIAITTGQIPTASFYLSSAIWSKFFSLLSRKHCNLFLGLGCDFSIYDNGYIARSILVALFLCAFFSHSFCLLMSLYVSLRFHSLCAVINICWLQCSTDTGKRGI